MAGKKSKSKNKNEKYKKLALKVGKSTLNLLANVAQNVSYNMNSKQGRQTMRYLFGD